MSLSIPITTSPGRSGTGASLALTYDSGNGNGPFGFGWQLSAGSISRKTSTGVPLYSDEDVFQMSDAEDLVPALRDATINEPASGDQAMFDERTVGDYAIRRYRPRVEGGVTRIERWLNTKDAGDIYWRTISATGATTIYGRNEESQIFHGNGGSKRIFSWLACETYDLQGNRSILTYKADDSSGLDLTLACEQHRDATARSTNKYMKSIKYGNRTPNRDLKTWEVLPPSTASSDQWLFEVVFDYGEYDASTPTTHEVGIWKSRNDPFSSYKSGFEIRSNRLCRRVLMFHHIPEKLDVDDCLVSAVILDYEESPAFTLLKSVTESGYMPDSKGSYLSESLPPVELKYTQMAQLNDLPLSEIDASSVLNLPHQNDPKSQWLDLDGEGAPGILAMIPGNGWYYQRNECSGFLPDSKKCFGPPRQIPILPNAGLEDGQFFFEDLDHDGRLDFVVLDSSGNMRGYFERTEDDDWTNFVPFATLPTLDLNNRVLRRVDLTGSGNADIVQSIDENGEVAWYPSLKSEGFGPQRQTMNSAEKPSLQTGDEQESFSLADMSGDGLSDIVRIRNGDISYWPNMGYGKFGSLVRMDKSPYMDHSDQFSVDRLRLLDVDGSGTTDLIYLPAGGTAHVYFNLAGNGWSEVQTVSTFPQLDQLSAVSAVDLLGNGTGCLCWVAPDEFGTTGLRYVDLTGGSKSHLLSAYSNGFGMETTVSYCPSTKYYHDDERRGIPWQTRLPFPIHCVDRVVIHDRIAQASISTRYAYHDGFYDGFEKEFRGFAMVEQWDAEDFAESVGNRVRYQQPPVHRRSWFHTGAFQQTTSLLDIFGSQQLSASKLPENMSTSDFREAHRALKGSLLREELFSDDQSPKAGRPFVVSESNYEVKMRQKRTNDLHGVFTVVGRETITCNYERMMDDPRIQHTFTLEVDRFGNTVKSASVSYGRLQSPLSDPRDRAKQQESIVNYSETDYTNAIEDADYFCGPSTAGSRSYRILAPSLPQRLSFDALTKDEFSFFREADEIASEPEPKIDPTRKQKLLLTDSRSYYRTSNLSGRLDYGIIQKFSVLDQSFQLASTESLLKGLLTRGTELLMPASDLVGTLKAAGYVDLDSSGNSWVPSSRSLFSRDGVNELNEARKNFYQTTTVLDPFANPAHENLDELKLLPISRTDSLGNKTEFSNDYVALQASLTTDPNGNRKKVVFSPLAGIAASAVMGKDTERLGDSVDGLTPVLSTDQLDQFIKDPLGPLTKQLLGNAGSRKISDTHRYGRTGTGGIQVPCFEAVISRDVHFGSTNPPASEAKILVTITYMNGHGSPFQVVELADQSSGGAQWRFNGWVIHDNKGQPVKQFSPFFSNTHDFRFQSDDGSQVAQATFLRDSIGRVIGTLNADHSWSKIRFDAWSQTTFDAGNTVLINDPMQDPDIGPSFKGLESSSYLPSWFDAHVKGDKWGQDAATKSSRYNDLPTTAHLDVAGRTFLSIAQNSSQELHSRSEFDLYGRLAGVWDPLDRLVVKSRHDLLSRCMYQASMDKAEGFTFFNVLGRKVLGWDARNMRTRTTYDSLGRPTGEYLKLGSASEILVGKTIYGESISDAAARNLSGQVVKSFDQAGVRTNVAFDFKGNCLHSETQLAIDYKNTLNWSDEDTVQLESTVYGERANFDAYNRAFSTVSPDGSTTRREFNLTGQAKSVSWAPPNSSQSFKPYIKDATYSVNGQRLSVNYGNGSETQYKYDPISLQLTNTRTTRDDRTVMQDLFYKYDCRGKITSIVDAAQQDIYFRNAKISPTQSFTYDALGRLVEARGREQFDADNGGGQSLKPFTSSPRSRDGIPGNGSQLCEYTETYKYDLAGNIVELGHAASSHPEIAGWTRKYSYNEPSFIDNKVMSNRLSQTVVGNSTEKYGYDDDAGRHGCMTSMPGFSSLQWDSHDKLRSCSTQILNNGTPETTWFVYDGNGNRVRKVTERAARGGAQPTKIKQTICLQAYEVYRTFAGDGKTIQLEKQTSHVVGDFRVALIESDSKGKTLERYQLGGSLELDDKGQVISYEEYSPFGATTYRACRSDVEAPSKYRYASYERDVETGLDYCGARYYASWLGRWTSPDPIGIGDGLNVFAYCGNDPINFDDHGGHGRNKKKVPSMEKGGPAASSWSWGGVGSTILSWAVWAVVAPLSAALRLASLNTAQQAPAQQGTPKPIQASPPEGKQEVVESTPVYTSSSHASSNISLASTSTSMSSAPKTTEYVPQNEYVPSGPFDFDDPPHGWTSLWRAVEPKRAQAWVDEPDNWRHITSVDEKGNGKPGDFNTASEVDDQDRPVTYFAMTREYGEKYAKGNQGKGAIIQQMVPNKYLDTSASDAHHYGRKPTKEWRMRIISNRLGLGKNGLSTDQGFPAKPDLHQQADFILGPISDTATAKYKNAFARKRNMSEYDDEFMGVAYNEEGRAEMQVAYKGKRLKDLVNFPRRVIKFTK